MEKNTNETIFSKMILFLENRVKIIELAKQRNDIHSKMTTDDNIFKLHEEEELIVKMILNHGKLNFDQQFKLVEITNRFIRTSNKMHSKRLIVLAGANPKYFGCFVLRDSMDLYKFSIVAYSAEPNRDGISDELRDKLDKYFQPEIETILKEPGNSTDNIAAHRKLIFGECKKTIETFHMPSDCDCHCIYACGFALLIASNRHPKDNIWDDDHLYRKFIQKTLLSGTLAESVAPILHSVNNDGQSGSPSSISINAIPFSIPTPDIEYADDAIQASGSNDIVQDITFNATNVPREGLDQVKNLLLRGDLNEKDQQIIVTTINETLSGDGTKLILRDHFNNGFMFVNGIQKRREKILEIYTPVSEEDKKIHESDKEVIKEKFNEWVGTDNAMSNVKFMPVPKPNNPKNYFIAVISYAVCLTKGMKVGRCIINGDDENEKIRKSVVNILNNH